MKHIHTKSVFLCGFLFVFLFADIFTVSAQNTSQQNEEEKTVWINYSKELFEYKIPKGYEVILPPAAGGGGETYLDLSLVPKSSKNKNQKITMQVYVAGFPTIEEYIEWGKEYGIKDLGQTTINGMTWHRYVPEGKNQKSSECHGTIKGDKQYQFCLDSGTKRPSTKFKKTYQNFLKSLKIK